ncbi:MAG: tripartite tricarboxylate transporter TctB family protein [Burkholderiaceae bacterium]
MRAEQQTLMNPDCDDCKAVPRWGSRHAIDALVAVFTLGIGAAMMFDSHRIGSGWDDGRLQSGYFPFRLGVIICIVSVAILARALLAARRESEPFVRWPQLRRVGAVLGAVLLYVGAIQFVGLYVATALLIAGFMRIASRYGWLAAAGVSIATTAVLFVLFEMVFLVPLPKGPLEALLGY